MKKIKKLVLLISLFLSIQVSASDDKKSVLLSISQEHSIASISSYGGLFKELNVTENLDRISREGVIFKNAFCTSSDSKISLTSLLTGKFFYQKKENSKGFQTKQNLPQILKKKGYITAFFGAWTNKDILENFDHWEILADPDQIYNPEFTSTNGNRKIEGHVTDIISDLTIHWINKMKTSSKPLFILVLYNGVEKPWIPPIRQLDLYNSILLPEPTTLRSNHDNKGPASRYQEIQIDHNLDNTNDLFLEYESLTSTIAKDNLINGQDHIKQLNGEQLSAWQLALRPQNEAFARSNFEIEDLLSWKYQRFAKNYLRCVQAIDENVGRIYKYISQDANELDWQFVYTACRGSFVGENGWFGSSWIYDPVMKIPLIVSGSKFEKGKLNYSMVNTSDIGSIILNIADISKKDALINIQKLEDPDQRVMYFEHHHFPTQAMVAKHYGIRYRDHKIIHYHQFDEWEFFDLSKDPKEQNNILTESTKLELFEQFKEILAEERKSLGLGKFNNPMPEEWRKIYRGPNARKKSNNQN